VSRWAAVAVFLFAWTLTTHGKVSVSGDEPHYLLITHSIVVDGDLDVANNYAQGDGRFFGSPSLEMEIHALPARSGHIRPIHDIGLAVALVPFYVVAHQLASWPSDAVLKRFRTDHGLLTYQIIGLFLIALTVTGLVMVGDALVASGLTSRTKATLLMSAIGVSPPVLSHSFLVFPEALGLLATSVVVWFSLKPVGPADRILLMVIVFALGLLPWSHHKYLLYVPGLLFLIAWMRRSFLQTLSGRDLALAFALCAAPPAGLLAWSQHEWGTFGGALTGALTSNTMPLSWEMFARGAPGLWIDRQQGLLAYAPMYWIVPVCWIVARRSTWPFLVPLVLLYVPAAAFNLGWWGGFSPAARYLVPAIPLFAVVIGSALRYRFISVLAIVLLVPQLVIDGIVWRHPMHLWPDGRVNRALEASGPAGRAYARTLPLFQDEFSPR